MNQTPVPHDVLCGLLKSQDVRCSPLSGDGSDRTYFRVSSSERGETYLLMKLTGKDAKALRNGSYPWIALGKTLKNVEICVPRVHSILPEYGTLMIDDLGKTMLEKRIQSIKGNTKKLYALYDQGFSIISKFMKIAPENDDFWSSKTFDHKFLQDELLFFQIQYLNFFPTFNNRRDALLFRHETNSLCHFIAKLSRHFVHRDFHSRNLMCVGSELGVLDFQDARWGPAAYDVVSLCFDAYVPLSPEKREEVLNRGLEFFAKNNNPELSEEISQSWRAVLLQRQLKAIGSFAYLTRKTKRDYAQYISPALKILNQIGMAEDKWPYLVNDMVPRLV
ncbi:MAG: phosphotransferase [Deltaproteobacteria bacterium]|nr:phosphotransferase [Deltaproteobacteria bacterium]